MVLKDKIVNDTFVSEENGNNNEKKVADCNKNIHNTGSRKKIISGDEKKRRGID